MAELKTRIAGKKTVKKKSLKKKPVKKAALKKKPVKKTPVKKASMVGRADVSYTPAVCVGTGTGARKRLEVTYKGRVQGVGFRFCAEKAALACAVTGWVRNEHNGDVEMVAEGAKMQLEALLDGVRQSPVGRHIKKELIRWEPCRNEFCDFTIEYHCS